MKYSEIVKEITVRLEKLESITISNGNRNAHLRVMGSMYNKYMYTKACKQLDPIYTVEAMLHCLELSVDYNKGYTFQNETHAINVIVKGLNRQLEWNYSEEIEDDFEI